MSKPQLFQSPAVLRFSQESGCRPYCQLRKGGQMWAKKGPLPSAQGGTQLDVPRHPGQRCGQSAHTPSSVWALCPGWEQLCFPRAPQKPGAVLGEDRKLRSRRAHELIPRSMVLVGWPGNEFSLLAPAGIIRVGTTKSFDGWCYKWNKTVKHNFLLFARPQPCIFRL